MGNNISTNQTGGKLIEEEKFYNTLNIILTNLLKDDMDFYLDKSYCDKN